MKKLSVYSLYCQVDHMLVVGKKDHLGLGPQVCQDFQGCPSTGVVEVDEGIVYEKGKGSPSALKFSREARRRAK